MSDLMSDRVSDLMLDLVSEQIFIFFKFFKFFKILLFNIFLPFFMIVSWVFTGSKIHFNDQITLLKWA